MLQLTPSSNVTASLAANLGLSGIATGALWAFHEAAFDGLAFDAGSSVDISLAAPTQFTQAGITKALADQVALSASHTLPTQMTSSGLAKSLADQITS